MGGSFLNAAMAVASGQANYVVVHKVMTMEGDNRYGQAFGQIGVKNPVVPGPMAFAVPYGLQSPGQMFALAARRHMHKYGTTDDQFAEVTINARLDGREQPGGSLPGAVHDRGPSRQPDDRRSVATVRLLHGTDYGCATIVTTAERARDLRQRPAYLAGAVAARAVSLRPRADGQLQHARRRLRVLGPARRRPRSSTGSAGAT